MPKTNESEPTTYMEFCNPGKVPLNAFKLLGASTKRGDATKIGFFGTGLKYSIALLLREKIPFKVYIGKKEVKFDVISTKFSGIKFDVITVDGEKTSLTTDAGIDWLPWYAVREIYTNALDEGGAMEVTDVIKPEANTTKIYISMHSKLGDVTRNWQSYFSTKREHLEEIVLKKGEENERTYRILPKRENQPEFRIFRKGILVSHLRHSNSLFDYDVSELTINESRVVKHDWEGRQRAAEALAQATNEDIIVQFIKSWRQPQLEHQEQFWDYLYDSSDYLGMSKFSNHWLELLRPFRLVPSDNTGFYGVTSNTIGLPNTLLKHLYSQFGDKLTIEGMSKTHFIITGDYPDDLDWTMQVLDDEGYMFNKENIKLAKFRDSNIKACWSYKDNAILISKEVLSYTEDKKLTIMLEEVLHARSGFSDHTRQFQDYILTELGDRIINNFNEKRKSNV